MTKRRKSLDPRQYEREPVKMTTLDMNNAVWAAQNKQLHPTKGWRKISVKRTLIADITQRMKHGQRGFDTKTIKDILQRKVFI